jgi:hypothetical protein
MEDNIIIKERGKGERDLQNSFVTICVSLQNCSQEFRRTLSEVLHSLMSFRTRDMERKRMKMRGKEDKKSRGRGVEGEE